MLYFIRFYGSAGFLEIPYGLGIVTGDNERFCLPEARENCIPVFKGSDIKRSGLKPPSVYIPSDFLLYQQVAPLNLYLSPEKLIYRFISSELVFFCDYEKRFILNSANMVVLNDDFPISHAQLCTMLNSKLMSWLFRKIFDTHKVLRGDLETLPIFNDYFNKNSFFNESKFLDFLSIEEVSSGAYRVKK